MDGAPGDDGIKGHVPRLDIDRRQLLQIIGNADQPGTSPPAAGPEKAEAPIIEAATCPETVSLIIESEQRDEYPIKLPRVDGAHRSGGLE
jgi:hypothetical protein